MIDTYILDGHKAIAVPLLEWAAWFEKNAMSRVVAQTEVAPDVSVSTVFLGIDHSFFGGTPVLFETMVFGGPFDGDMNRYSTWEEAEAGHSAMVAKVSA